MKIKTKLLASAILVIVLVLLVVSTFFVAHRKFVEALQQDSIVDEIVDGVFKLDEVTYDFLLYHEERAQVQWQSRHASMQELLFARDFGGSQGQELVESLRQDHKNIGELFARLVANQKRGEEPAAGEREIFLSQELEKRFVRQMVVTLRMMVSDAFQLADIGREEAIATQEAGGLIFVVFAFVLIAIMTAVLFFANRSVMRPIMEFQKGARRISRGNLRYRIRIKSKDEFGDLAVTFNDMAAKLKESYGLLEGKVQERTADLEMAKNKSEALLASMGDGVFAIDKEQNVVHLNKQAEEMSGYAVSEVLGKPYYDSLKFVKEEDGSENLGFIRAALRGKMTEMTDHTMLVRKDGSGLPVADTASPLKDEKGNIVGAIVVFRDATQERQVEHMREELISLTSHQLKAPLTLIKGNVEMLKEGKLGPEEKKLADEVEDVAKDMQKLVLDLLNVSRIEQGRTAFKSEAVQLEELVGALVERFSSAAEKRKVRIEFKKPAQPLPILQADTEYLKEALQNILSNAIDYTTDEVTIELKKQDSVALLSFSDNGIGIPEDERPRIFEKFYRTSNAKKAKDTGTGLGLSITKAIIERLGGKVWFESEENKGTTFYVSLPVA